MIKRTTPPSIIAATSAVLFFFNTMSPFIEGGSGDVFAQSGEKWSFGLNSPSGNAAFGTSNNFPLIIKTYGTEWVRITPDGKVGIGTTAPADKLQVAGRASAVHFKADSLMQALQMKAQSAEFTAALVTGSLNVNGQITAGSLTVTGNTQLSDVSANHVTVSGILSAQTILQNGNPIQSSQWVTSGNNIYYNQGNIGLGISFPQSAIHIGDGSGTNIGHRSWMQKGIFFDSNSDNCFFGLKQVGSDAIDAIINWGNNPLEPNYPQNTDRLRFVFTAYPGFIADLPKSGSSEGFEVARMLMAYDHPTKTELARMGMGDFFTPVSGLSKDPLTALEIRANRSSAGKIMDPSPSGLRFSYLNSDSAAVTNPGAGVLGLNAQGDVIYVKDASANKSPVFDSIAVSNKIQIGNSTLLIYGATNEIFTKSTATPYHLFIQSNPLQPNNTIINANNNGKVLIGNIPGSISPDIKMEIGGSVSIANHGNVSLFFGRENPNLQPPATNFGEWGIQYWHGSDKAGGNGLGGMNFWKPYGSSGSGIGNGFGNAFLFLQDDGNVGIGCENPVYKLDIDLS